MMRSPAGMSSHASVKRASVWSCRSVGTRRFWTFPGEPALLACPKDTGHPCHLTYGNVAVRMFGVERSELKFRCALALQDFRHDLAAGSLHHDAVAAPDARCRRNDDNIALAIEQQHRIARDLGGIGIIGKAGEGDLVPALARGEPSVVEKTSGAGFCKANKRHLTKALAEGRRCPRASGRRLDRMRGILFAALRQPDESVEGLTGRCEHLGDRLCGRPSRTVLRIGSVPLGRIERGSVEAGLPCQRRRAQTMAHCERVDRTPNGLVVPLRHEFPAPRCRNIVLFSAGWNRNPISAQFV